MANLKLGVTIGGNVAIHSGNYNSYAPTLTGGNASGTWAISISGNSATTSQTNFSSLTIGGAAVATQAYVTSLGYLTSYTETDPYRVTSAAVTGTTTKTLTLTRADSSTVTATWTDYDSDSNTFVNAASFNTGNGILTLTRNDGGTVTVDLDDRYALSGSYLTAESDTLATVTGRGASTSTAVALSGGATISGITNNGDLVNNGKIVVQNSTDGTNARGIFMWQAGDSNWGIYMATAAAGVSLAGGTSVASIDGRTSHHIRFRVYNASGNGFIWENHSEQSLMSLTSNTGHLYTRGQIYPSNQTSYYLYEANSGLWTNGNFGASGDLYLGTRSTWLSSWLNQSVQTGAGPTFSSVTVNGVVGNWGGQTRDKLRVWDGSSYTIGMKNGYDYGHLGNDEYAMSFQMNNNSGRGFWWGDDAHSDDQGAASLTTDGRMVIAKSLSIGEGEAVVSPSSTPLYVKGSTSGADVFAVDGINGRLFTVSDDLSDSLFSVNTIAGLPVIEAFADNIVKIGKYGTNAIHVGADGRVGFSTTDFSYTTGELGSPTANKVFVNGSIQLLGANDAIVFGRGTGTTLKDENLLFGWGGGWYMSDASYVRTVGNKAISTGGGSVDYVGSIYMNGGVYIQTYNDRNLIIKGSSSSDTGIEGRNAAGNNTFQIYGEGTNYGFLNGTWAAWDLKKTKNGALYMNDNNSYYLHTNSTSYLYSLSVNQNLFLDNNFGSSIVGVYSDTRYQGVFAMGNSYKLSLDGTSPGTLYGLAWTHSNIGGESKSGLGHQLLVMDNGITQSAIGRGIWTNGTITTTSHGTSANWNTAYDKRPTAIAFSGGSTKTLTLTQGDGSTLTASFSDIDTDTNTDGQTLSISGSTLTISGGNSVTLPSGGISQATADGLYQPLENQRLSTTNSPTFVDIYANEWFRNNNVNEGLYNQATGTHFYSNGATSWAITGSGGNIQLEFRSNHQSTIRGFVYADTSNNIGFLNDGGSWALRMSSTRNAEIFGSDLTIGAGGANSTNIIMGDNDEGGRTIHCNSNRIGFLTQAGAWGAYADDSANWFSTGYIQSFTSMYSPIYYDGNDSSYYGDFASTSRLNTLHLTNHIKQGNNQAFPLVKWGASGSTTGMVVIKLPGNTNNYGMVHMQINVYEYSGNNVSTIIVGGHNWASRWYSYGAKTLGQPNKQIRVGFRDGQYCVIIGDTSSTWSYGSVSLVSINNGEYYDNQINLSGAYSISQVPDETFDWISENLNTGADVPYADYATTAGTLSSMNISQFTNNSGYLTSLPSHNHDDRYYTESESDSRFAAASHSHEWTSITSKPTASNWSTNGNSIDVVVGMLSWKNYGDGHVIFDASRSTSPSGSAVSNANPDNYWTGTYPTLMGWNGSNTYGVRVDVSRYSESTGSVAWTNVSSRPTALSQFTNDLGNYGGWITSSGSISGNAATATSATQVVTIQDSAPGGAAGKLWWESDTGKLKVYYGSAWVDATPVPDMALYYAKAGGSITGDVTIQQTLTVVGNTLIQGVLTETSDISLKENILPLESSLDKLMKLNGVSFNKKTTPHVKEIGFIAQEVEEIIPDLVTETSDGIKTVAYSRVSAILVETVKEQQAQIDELKEMVNTLTKKLNNL